MPACPKALSDLPIGDSGVLSKYPSPNLISPKKRTVSGPEVWG